MTLPNELVQLYGWDFEAQVPEFEVGFEFEALTNERWKLEPTAANFLHGIVSFRSKLCGGFDGNTLKVCHLKSLDNFLLDVSELYLNEDDHLGDFTDYCLKSSIFEIEYSTENNDYEVSNRLSEEVLKEAIKLDDDTRMFMSRCLKPVKRKHDLKCIFPEKDELLNCDELIFSGTEYDGDLFDQLKLDLKSRKFDMKVQDIDETYKFDSFIPYGENFLDDIKGYTIPSLSLEPIIFKDFKLDAFIVDTTIDGVGADFPQSIVPALIENVWRIESSCESNISHSGDFLEEELNEIAISYKLNLPKMKQNEPNNSVAESCIDGFPIWIMPQLTLLNMDWVFFNNVNPDSLLNEILDSDFSKHITLIGNLESDHHCASKNKVKLFKIKQKLLEQDDVGYFESVNSIKHVSRNDSIHNRDTFMLASKELLQYEPESSERLSEKPATLSFSTEIVSTPGSMVVENSTIALELATSPELPDTTFLRPNKKRKKNKRKAAHTNNSIIEIDDLIKQKSMKKIDRMEFANGTNVTNFPMKDILTFSSNALDIDITRHEIPPDFDFDTLPTVDDEPENSRKSKLLNYQFESQRLIILNLSLRNKDKALFSLLSELGQLANSNLLVYEQEFSEDHNDFDIYLSSNLGLMIIKDIELTQYNVYTGNLLVVEELMQTAMQSKNIIILIQINSKHGSVDFEVISKFQKILSLLNIDSIISEDDAIIEVIFNFIKEYGYQSNFRDINFEGKKILQLDLAHAKDIMFLKECKINNPILIIDILKKINYDLKDFITMDFGKREATFSDIMSHDLLIWVDKIFNTTWSFEE
ncbi:hypothetical protein PACTADRAFT_31661 [Pachysolen tannophilus NRRL Y-2460]|uniref:Uncharacterized protein n=1 Tax=Pachysolen tannophilus NRRL Y-2460 TaxID=669874 RepID=A0A1E4U2P2_PACTA|nr:hypothetical protein PACTADRAFT_31661 [Pachysolen tannophilus NRRL Y-2460]